MQDHVSSESVSFENLPAEVIYQIFANIPDIKTLMKLREVSSQVKALAEALTLFKPEAVFHIISHLPLSHVMGFIQFYRTTEAFQQLNKSSDDPYEVFCYALTTNDVNTIDQVKLQEAITIAKEKFAAKQDEAEKACFIGLQITAHLLQDNPGPLILDNMFAIPFFINLARMKLTFSLAEHILNLNINPNKLEIIPELKHHLAYANLEGTYLHKANLEGVNWEGANLEEADLTHANLKNSILRKTNLVNIKVSTKSFTQAENVTLENAQGLDELFRFFFIMERYEAAEFLLKAGANINSLNECGIPVLRYCLSFPDFNTDRAEWLLRHGLDVNIKNRDGETLLVETMRSGIEKGTNWLLCHGAQPITETQSEFIRKNKYKKAKLRFQKLELQLKNIISGDFLIAKEKDVWVTPTKKEIKKAFIKALTEAFTTMSDKEDIHYLHKFLFLLKHNYPLICEQVKFLNKSSCTSKAYATAVQLIQDKTRELVHQHIYLDPEQERQMNDILSFSQFKVATNEPLPLSEKEIRKKCL